jgi:hypothetical protein
MVCRSAAKWISRRFFFACPLAFAFRFAPFYFSRLIPRDCLFLDDGYQVSAGAPSFALFVFAKGGRFFFSGHKGTDGTLTEPRSASTRNRDAAKVFRGAELQLRHKDLARSATPLAVSSDPVRIANERPRAFSWLLTQQVRHDFDEKLAAAWAVEFSKEDNLPATEE